MRCDWGNNYLTARGLWAASRTPRILALAVLACACIHQDYVPAALDALACATHTPDCIPPPLDALACACIHQDCIGALLFFFNFFFFFFCTDMRARRAASDNGCTGMPLHTPGLHPRYAGCTGMRKHTPGLHPATTGCTGMRYAYTSTASPHNAERILFSFLLKQNNEK